MLIKISAKMFKQNYLFLISPFFGRGHSRLIFIILVNVLRVSRDPRVPPLLPSPVEIGHGAEAVGRGLAPSRRPLAPIDIGHGGVAAAGRWKVEVTTVVAVRTVAQCLLNRSTYTYKSSEFKMTHQAMANRWSLTSRMLSVVSLILFSGHRCYRCNAFLFFGRTDGHHVSK